MNRYSCTAGFIISAVVYMSVVVLPLVLAATGLWVSAPENSSSTTVNFRIGGDDAIYFHEAVPGALVPADFGGELFVVSTTVSDGLWGHTRWRRSVRMLIYPNVLHESPIPDAVVQRIFAEGVEYLRAHHSDRSWDVRYGDVATMSLQNDTGPFSRYHSDLSRRRPAGYFYNTFTIIGGIAVGVFATCAISSRRLVRSPGGWDE